MPLSLLSWRLDIRYFFVPRLPYRIYESYHFPALQLLWPDKNNTFSSKPIFRNISISGSQISANCLRRNSRQQVTPEDD
jgi:hypothetical protein